MDGLLHPTVENNIFCFGGWKCKWDSSQITFQVTATYYRYLLCFDYLYIDMIYYM
jgi:hypothetical protein